MGPPFFSFSLLYFVLLFGKKFFHHIYVYFFSFWNLFLRCVHEFVFLENIHYMKGWKKVLFLSVLKKRFQKENKYPYVTNWNILSQIFNKKHFFFWVQSYFSRCWFNDWGFTINPDAICLVMTTEISRNIL